MKSISAFLALGLVSILTIPVNAANNPHKCTTDQDSPSSGKEITAEGHRLRRKSGLTYNKDIAPLIIAHCASCHRPGEVAPFSLLSYSDVRKRASQIVQVTSRQFMPPWKADSHGEFEGENRLTSDQTGLIKQWVDEASPEGDASDLPEPRTFTPGWRLGPPDAELAPERSFSLGASGGDEFHTFLLPTDFPEDRYLSAVEVRPGNRAVVHHTIVCVDRSGRFRKLAEESGRMDFSRGFGIPEGVLDVWTPGKIQERLPRGIGMFLPKGADVVIEVHYHRTGKPEQDRTKIGLYFCKEPVKQLLHISGLNASRLSIAPGDANYRTDGQMPVLVNATLLSIFPHMHQIGKTMRVTLTLPDGTQKPLVNVPAWDFSWQNTYRYKEPIKLPRGSTIKMTATYDNSAANPRNPNTPPKHIDWGEQTTDEMGLVLFAFTVDNEDLDDLIVRDPVSATGREKSGGVRMVGREESRNDAHR